MLFHQLPVGLKFRFRHAYDPGETWAYAWDWNTKTGARTYERVWGDGSKREGTVGVGDQPVQPVDEAA